jgi:23S rRNA (adenine-N6)-dimethyltransferase
VPGAPCAAAGAHFLADRSLIAQLVAAARVGRGDLVLDLGAGFGALTAPLARTGAAVLAIERDPLLAARLRRRFDGQRAVRVLEADLRTVRLPRREFWVVASPPFAITTLLCRRLLGAAEVRLAGAELLLGWGAACWLTAARPRDAESAWWAARYQARLIRRAEPECFSPPPRTAAGYVRLRRRAGVGGAGSQRQLRRLIRAAFRSPELPLVALAATHPGLAVLPEARVRQLLDGAGVPARRPASTLTAEQWALVAAAVGGAGPGRRCYSRTGP